MFKYVKWFLEILNPPTVDDFIRIIQHDDDRGVILRSFVGKKPERHDSKAVAFFSKVGDGSVKDNRATAARGWDGVGLEAVAVRLVADQNFLEWRDARGFEEFLVDRHAALVIHIRVGNDRAVDLGAEKMF